MFTIWNVFLQSFVLQLACGRYGFMFSVLAFKKNMPNYIELHLFSFPTLFQHDNNNDKRNSQSIFVFTIKKRFNYVSCYLFSILISNHLLQFQHFVFMSIFAYIFFFVLPSISFSFLLNSFVFAFVFVDVEISKTLQPNPIQKQIQKDDANESIKLLYTEQ